MRRTAYLLGGWGALLLGGIGLVLPILPTVPFVILAAFCFARSSPALERRLLDHPGMGPHIRAWRERGAISRRGKIAATLAFAASAAAGLLIVDGPARWLPLAAGIVGCTWIWRRPDI